MAKKTLLGKLKEEVIANPTGRTDDEVLGELIDMATTEAQLQYLTRKNHIDDPTKVRDLEWKLSSKQREVDSFAERYTSTLAQNRTIQETINLLSKMMVDQNLKTVELLTDKLTEQATKSVPTKSKDEYDCCEDCG